MTHDPKAPAAPPPVADPKADLEARLVTEALEPWSALLDPDHRACMEWALDLFMATHPAMQRAIDERLKRAGATVPGAAAQGTPAAGQGSRITVKKARATAAHGGKAGRPGQSGVVAKDAEPPDDAAAGAAQAGKKRS